MLHTIRHKNGGLVEIETDLRTAIEVQCTECMGYDDPKECTSINCSLYPFRKKSTLAIKTRSKDNE